MISSVCYFQSIINYDENAQVAKNHQAKRKKAGVVDWKMTKRDPLTHLIVNFLTGPDAVRLSKSCSALYHRMHRLDPEGSIWGRLYHEHYEHSAVQGDMLLRSGVPLSATDNRFVASRFYSARASLRLTNIQVWKGHETVVTCLAMCPEGYVATGSRDHTVRLWSKDGDPVAVFRGHTDIVRCLVLLDGGCLASGSYDHTIRLWDAHGGEIAIWRGHQGAVCCFALLPESRLASGSTDATIRIWDSHGTTLTVLSGHEGAVACMKLLPSGKLASGSDDRTIRVWDTATGDAKVLRGHTSFVISLGVFHNGTLVSSSGDQTLRFWDEGGVDIRRITAHSIVTSLTVLNNGLLATGEVDGTIRLRTPRGEFFDQYRVDDMYVTSLTTLQDGRLAATINHTIRIWDVDPHELVLKAVSCQPVTSKLDQLASVAQAILHKGKKPPKKRKNK